MLDTVGIERMCISFAPDKCAPCGGDEPTAFNCQGCGKPVCVECVMDEEARTLRCWMCLDWTAEGQARRQPRRRRG